MVLTQVASSTQWRVHIFMDCTAFPPANLHMTWDLPDRILFRICPLEVRNSSPFPLLIACLCALGVQIKAMRSQLDMLKNLAPLFGAGVHQMDGGIGESSGNPSPGLALHQPAAAHPPPGAVHRHKLVIKEFRQSKGHIHIRAVVNEVVRNAQ